MKKNLNLLLALALVLTLGLGFSSCKNDDPEPIKDTDIKFINELLVNEEFLDVCNVNFTYTDVNGKVTEVNARDCHYKQEVYKGQTYKFYFLSEVQHSDKIPSQTNLKVSFEMITGKPFSEDIPVLIMPNFSVGQLKNKTDYVKVEKFFTEWYEMVSYEKLPALIEKLNKECDITCLMETSGPRIHVPKD
ncbi:MAG: hypothetical protein HUK14_00385 [Muribaculaceae bacterium]|nr:hypothetical protein [Muribaculaceae bacterium]